MQYALIVLRHVAQLVRFTAVFDANKTIELAGTVSSEIEGWKIALEASGCNETATALDEWRFTYCGLQVRVNIGFSARSREQCASNCLSRMA